MNNKLIIKSMSVAFLFALVLGVMVLSAGDTVSADDNKGGTEQDSSQEGDESGDGDDGADDGDDEGDETTYNLPGVVFTLQTEKGSAQEGDGDDYEQTLETAPGLIVDKMFFFTKKRGDVRLNTPFDVNTTDYEITLASHMAFVNFTMTFKEAPKSVVIAGSTANRASSGQYFGVFTDAYRHEDAQKYQIVVTASNDTSRTYNFTVGRSGFFNSDGPPEPVRNLTGEVIHAGKIAVTGKLIRYAKIRWDPPIESSRRAVTNYDITWKNKETGTTFSIPRDKMPRDLVGGIDVDGWHLIHDTVYADPGDIVEFTITPWNSHGKGKSKSTEIEVPCVETIGCPVPLLPSP